MHFYVFGTADSPYVYACNLRRWKNSCCVKTKKPGPEIKYGIRASAAAGRDDYDADVGLLTHFRNLNLHYIYMYTQTYCIGI